VGYAEAGPADGPVVILLHGWPYDIHSYVDVAPLLASAGFRVIVPHLRGHGTTRFLSNGTFRNGQQAVVAVDIIALMDALKIEKATVAGYDWGGRNHKGTICMKRSALLNLIECDRGSTETSIEGRVDPSLESIIAERVQSSGG
jgi:pimeloyl-ACP methyl ester carboxylesterase